MKDPVVYESESPAEFFIRHGGFRMTLFLLAQYTRSAQTSAGLDKNSLSLQDHTLLLNVCQSSSLISRP